MANRSSGWSPTKIAVVGFLGVSAVTFLGNPQWPVVGPAIAQLQSGVKYLQSKVGVHVGSPAPTATAANPGPAAAPGDLNAAHSANPAIPAANNNIAAETTAAAAGTAAVQTPPPVQNTAYQRPADKIYIASFNIQVFGESKMAKADVVNILVQIIRQFDIVAIQEVRAQSDDVVPRFVAAINAAGANYSYVIGPRLGRTNSKEQYTFIYDANRIEVDPMSVGTIADPNDLLHREPYVARFRPRTSYPDRAFSFWMVDIHTDPDEAIQEVNVLADVFQLMQKARADEDDVLLLGDLNTSEKKLGKLGQLPGIGWVVANVPTNTKKTQTYDNIIYDTRATREFTGRWGVFDTEKLFGITQEQALRVSDHMPIWAEFDIWEANQASNVAGSPAPVAR